MTGLHPDFRPDRGLVRNFGGSSYPGSKRRVEVFVRHHLTRRLRWAV